MIFSLQNSQAVTIGFKVYYLPEKGYQVLIFFFFFFQSLLHLDIHFAPYWMIICCVFLKKSHPPPRRNANCHAENSRSFNLSIGRKLRERERERGRTEIQTLQFQFFSTRNSLHIHPLHGLLQAKTAKLQKYEPQTSHKIVKLAFYHC